MEIQPIIEIAGAILVSLGGGAVIIFSFSNWLGKLWANRLMEREKAEYRNDLERFKGDLSRDLEQHKVKLKKSEFLFQKEFDAASELVAYHEEMMPPALHPDMHMDDVFLHIFDTSEDTELWIKSFVTRNGVVMPKEVRSNMIMASRIAGECKFSSIEDNEEGLEHKIERGREIYNHIRMGMEVMKNKVWKQAVT